MRSPAAPGGFWEQRQAVAVEEERFRGGSWFLASLMPGLTITSGNVSRHGSHQGGLISATAGARLGQNPSLGSGAGWWEQNVPSRTCGLGRASAGPGPAARAQPPASLRGRIRPPEELPGSFWGPMGCGMGFNPMLRAVVSWGLYPPPTAPGASPHHPGGSTGHTLSPPWWRQQLSPTLFWDVYGVSVYSRF